MSPPRTRNYRLFLLGQMVSVPGTWLQTIAQAWLVLTLTSSGAALGVTVALQTLPVLLIGPWGGSLADAVDKRRLLIATQAAQAVLAFALGALVLTGTVQLWMVWALALGLGTARALDSPTRQSFVSEMVEGRALARAISLNSTVVAAARMIGPAAGGVLIAAVGVGPCFLINGASFAAVIGALALMDQNALLRVEPEGLRTDPGRVRAGLRYVRTERELLVPLLMMALVGTLAYEFQVTIPLLAHATFGLGATGFGLLYASMGLGSVIAGLALGGRIATRIRTIALSALLFGAGLAAAAVSPTPVTAALCLCLAGAASVLFSSTSNASLQLHAALAAGALGCLAAAGLALSPLAGGRERLGRRTAPARARAG